MAITDLMAHTSTDTIEADLMLTLLIIIATVHQLTAMVMGLITVITTLTDLTRPIGIHRHTPIMVMATVITTITLITTTLDSGIKRH